MRVCYMGWRDDDEGGDLRSGGGSCLLDYTRSCYSRVCGDVLRCGENCEPRARLVGVVMTRPLICLDPGHPSRQGDVGCSSGDFREFEFTWDVAMLLNARLIKDGRYDTRFSRNRIDEAVWKTRGVRAKGADCVVSIHADAAANTSAHGARIYCYCGNRPNLSQSLARSILPVFPQPLNRRMIETDPKPRPDYVGYPRVCNVLDLFDAPVKVLIECGFVTNDIDFAALQSATVCIGIAGAIHFGLDQVFFPGSR